MDPIGGAFFFSQRRPCYVFSHGRSMPRWLKREWWRLARNSDGAPSLGEQFSGNGFSFWSFSKTLPTNPWSISSFLKRGLTHQQAFLFIYFLVCFFSSGKEPFLSAVGCYYQSFLFVFDGNSLGRNMMVPSAAMVSDRSLVVLNSGRFLLLWAANMDSENLNDPYFARFNPIKWLRSTPSPPKKTGLVGFLLVALFTRFFWEVFYLLRSRDNLDRRFDGWKLFQELGKLNTPRFVPPERLQLDSVAAFIQICCLAIFIYLFSWLHGKRIVDRGGLAASTYQMIWSENHQTISKTKGWGIHLLEFFNSHSCRGRSLWLVPTWHFVNISTWYVSIGWRPFHWHGVPYWDVLFGRQVHKSTSVGLILSRSVRNFLGQHIVNMQGFRRLPMHIPVASSLLHFSISWCFWSSFGVCGMKFWQNLCIFDQICAL